MRRTNNRTDFFRTDGKTNEKPRRSEPRWRVGGRRTVTVTEIKKKFSRFLPLGIKEYGNARFLNTHNRWITRARRAGFAHDRTERPTGRRRHNDCGRGRRPAWLLRDETSTEFIVNTRWRAHLIGQTRYLTVVKTRGHNERGQRSALFFRLDYRTQHSRISTRGVGGERRRVSQPSADVCGNIVGVVVVVVIRRLTGPRTPPRAGRRMAQIFFFDLFPKKITNFTVSADPARINAVRVLFVVLRRTLCYFRFLQHRNNFTTP